MAHRINDNVRSDWDSIVLDSESEDTGQHQKPKRITKITKIRIKGNAKKSSSLSEELPTQKQQSNHSDVGEDLSSLTQDCITLEPRPSIVASYPWLPVQERHQLYRQNISPIKQSTTRSNGKTLEVSETKISTSKAIAVSDIHGSSDQSSGRVEDRVSVDDSDQDMVMSGQKTASSVDETEESLMSDDESDSEPLILSAAHRLRLPNDSDDEEFKAAKDRRVRAYAENGQVSSLQSPRIDEQKAKQAIKNGHQRTPIKLISSDLPSTQAGYSPSQQSQMLPPAQIRQKDSIEDRKEGLLVRSNQIPIPVSSSTEASQNSHSSKPEDVQVLQTSSRSKMRNGNASLKDTSISSDPSLPVNTSVIVAGQSDLLPEQTRSKAALPSPSRQTYTSATQGNISPRKHPRSPPESKTQSSSSPRKRQRMDSPITILPKGRATKETLRADTSLAPASNSQDNQIHHSITQTHSPQESLKTKPTAPLTTDTSSLTPYRAAQSTRPTSPKSESHIQEQSLGEIHLDHTLPQISASQPVPERPRIGQAPQAKMMATSPGTKMVRTEMARRAAAMKEKTPDSQEMPSSFPVQLDLEPLIKILQLRGQDYCMAIQNDRIYRSLQSLFCDFLASHLGYLGNMEHLFNLCIWLLRSLADDYQEERIDEEFWDDFILQHQQGKYDAYVQHCLVKFRQPGSWGVWYQQAQRSKLSNNVVSVARLQRILLGKDPAITRRKIPLLWTRFMHASKEKRKESNR